MGIPHLVAELPLASFRSPRSFSKDDKRNKARGRRYETIAVSEENKNHKQHCQHKTFYHLSSRSVSLYTPSLSSDRDCRLSVLKLKALIAKLAELKQPVEQTVKKHYASAIDYQTYRLTNRSPRYDYTVLSYFAKLVKKFKSQLKAHFFDPEYRISIIGFLRTIELPCDTNKTHDGPAMWVLLQFVKENIANALNSRVCTEGRTASLTATVRYNGVRPRRLLRWYPEVVSNLLKKYPTGVAIAEYDATVLRYMQSVSMTPQQFADD